MEASKPVSVQLNLRDQHRKLPMQSLLGDCFFSGGGGGLFCLGGFGLF